MKKKISVGFCLYIISGIMGLCGLVSYLINCRTNYFADLEVSPVIVICLAAAILLELVFVSLSYKNSGNWLNVFPPVISMLIMAGTVTFTGSRLNGFAFIMTFQKNANTLADMRSGVIGILCCALALVISICAAFCEVHAESEK